ncbi:Hypothetical protein PHPALM_8770 [Phytophthora palmivora]|uniref:Uncharacterized protein n=1 Tax=Phytophthora palmivora TaxID=4796 RepID=A0A2P4Y907_9STRA|nr:Hypothetical protein PHPALM_8770 [Phytophthora palmivora]
MTFAHQTYRHAIPALAVPVQCASDASLTARNTSVLTPITDATEQGDADSVAITESTDQIAVVRCATTAGTELTSAAMPNSIEQGDEVNLAILGATGKRSNETDTGEAKSKADDSPNQIEDLVDFEVIDSDSFMEGCERSDYGEDVMEDNVIAPDLVEGVDDVEDLDLNEGDPDLRNVTPSGWIMY